MQTTRLAILASLLGLGACAVPPPSAPTVLGMPAEGKNFGQFQQEDATCRNHAAASVGTGAQVATQNSVGTAVAGTAVGAAAGALIGSATGNLGAGAAIGAGTGLVAGSAIGANQAAYAGGSLQQRYDATYAQCMVAYGNRIQGPIAPAYGYGYPPYGGYAYPYPGYAYPAYGYPAYGYYPPAYAAPPVVLGLGFGWGWGPRYGWGRGWGHRWRR